MRIYFYFKVKRFAYICAKLKPEILILIDNLEYFQRQKIARKTNQNETKYSIDPKIHICDFKRQKKWPLERKLCQSPDGSENISERTHFIAYVISCKTFFLK